MSMREIPVAYEFTCDGCGAQETKTSKSRPSYWCDLTVAQDAYDYSGAAVADGTIKRSLCSDCREAVVKAINDATAARRARTLLNGGSDAQG